ncbi:DNA cytosine methyltransferase [Eubacteriales bacterium OttesenSCG-928-K08]|nr:DNA cytosine methyltransferase [Eubacteriales bacterium OttesenSCG-928-K08]
MHNINQITLGSLFDGIGGFPYAGLFYGIQPLWASEILPHAVSVTKRHMPWMEHVGDITALDGAKLPPVDIITFGSPCQGLSTAGRRLGLADERSALFSEAIRIIDEMREATNGKYPRFALWENVPGALSSAGCRDFRAVLEAFTKSKIPIPQSGRWANAGMVRSGGVDLAWRVLNAQHFGVAQRRRRIFLVCDFAGRRAGEVLFVEESLRGNPAPCGEARQGIAAHAQGGAHGSVQSVAFACNQRDEVRDLHNLSAALCAQPGMKQQTFLAVNCLTPWDIQQSRIFTEDGTSPTLAGADGGGGRNPAGLVFTAGFCAGAGAKAKGIGYAKETAPTLKGGGGGFQMPTVFCAASSQAHAGITEELAGTLTCQHEQPFICEPELARTLTARGDGSPCTDRGPNVVALGAYEPIPIHDKATRYKGGGPTRNGDGAGNGLGVGKPGDPAPTMTAGDHHAAAIPINMQIAVRGDALGEGTGFGVGKDDSPAFTLQKAHCHAVAAVDCRNYKETGNLSGTLQAKNAPGYSLNYQNPVRTGYIVRRLTPTECERLQGYPDDWTAVGYDGKVISDTRRYQMLGNSVAVPCVGYILREMAWHMAAAHACNHECGKEAIA